jgi:hypothetical protein
MPQRTAFLSKLVGIYCILVGIAMGFTKTATVQMVIQMVHDAPVLFVFGLVMVAAGLAMVLSHNIWSGGALPVIVTLVGWLTLIKGLAFLFFPPPAAVGVVVWGPAYERYFYIDIALAVILGIYLTYGGFKEGKRADGATRADR